MGLELWFGLENKEKIKGTTTKRLLAILDISPRWDICLAVAASSAFENGYVPQVSAFSRRDVSLPTSLSGIQVNTELA